MNSTPPPSLLQTLREIQTPDAAAWLPLAPGWWLLAGILVTALLLLIIHGYRRGALRRAALAELEQIRRCYAAEPRSDRLAGELSMLLRRLVLVRFPREEVAALTGTAWLQFLDHACQRRLFSQGAGLTLANHPYDPDSDCDSERLLQLVETWIRCLR